MNTAQAGMLANLFPLALIFLIFYFILIRPQQKQQKEFKKMLESLKKNDQVVTVGGIHGTIINVKEKTLIIRIDDNTRVEVDKSAVGRLEKPGA
ncbi:MAG: preprotein translocase subunit YajC [Candidatus Omnitrophota bacterium]|jgi:preprotein translocase subunit YajC|nr:preprotein translocase subunit YajC [Candidatus Omnitrophota bacterium]MDD5137303.1 preprotein translocase subunit YajC [Candidatus Omnitrophota bacterium]MDD5537523.1 preprotein translocase subunit YajC [Candidatus Omnitrophota bacterium]